MKKSLVVALIVKGTDIVSATSAVRRLLRFYFSKNPRLSAVSLDADVKIGQIATSGIKFDDLGDCLIKASQKLRASRGWTLRFDISEIPLESEKAPDPVETEREVQEPSEGLPLTIKRHGPYMLLLTADVMQRLAQVPEGLRSLLGDTLRDLALGKWQEWSTKTVPGFRSWQEGGQNGVLFSFAIPDVGVLIWDRAWSVDLLSQIRYPRGTYYNEPPARRRFAPHIIIRDLLERPSPPSLEFPYDGRLYQEKVDLNKDESFFRQKPTDQIAYSEELYLLSRPRIQDLLDGHQRGLPLHLSEEQVRPVVAQGPVLLSGEAGSGKTSVITQWLVINHLKRRDLIPRPPDPIKQLFVTFSKKLRDNNRYEFETMLPSGGRNHLTQFKTYGELLEEISGLAGIATRYSASAEMTFERFMGEFARDVSPAIDPVLLWDEIRSVIKGGVVTGADLMLDYVTYEGLSERRGRCKTPRRMRKTYYEWAQKYQNYLDKNGLWDGLDLARSCLTGCDVAPKYARIACDEVQDLAPLEIHLLVSLLEEKSVEFLFFTGDVAQVINPSGFQWGRLKADLHEVARGQPIPEVFFLKRNYRSCSEIVTLVNEVLKVREELLDDEVSKVKLKPLLPARVRPMELRKSPLKMLLSQDSNPNRRLILTKTREEKEKLRALLGEGPNRSALLTVEQAKGLEYEGVLLWKFFLPRHEAITKNDWEQVFVEEKRHRLGEAITRGEKNPYGLTYEFNLLHVGLTRARRLLFVYDESEMRLTNVGQNVAEAVAEADLDDFAFHWSTEAPSPEELYEAASRLEERDTDQSSRLFGLAADAFGKEGDHIRAAECHMQARAHYSAALCYRAAKDYPSELHAMALHHEDEDEWADAGRLHYECGKTLADTGARGEASRAYEDSRRCYKEAGDFDNVAEAAWSAAKILPLERSVDRSRMFDAAASWADEAKQPERAIQARKFSIAEAERAKQSGQRIIPGEAVEYWIAGQYIEIAKSYESLRKHANAATEARKAAGLCRTIADLPEWAHLRSRFEEQCRRALESSIRNLIMAGETSQTAVIRKELLEAFRNTGAVGQAKKAWEEFGELYLKAKEYEEYVDTELELAGFLVENREYKGALDGLTAAADACKKLEPIRFYVRLLGGIILIAGESQDWGEMATSLVTRAKAHERAGETRKAFEDFHSAGKAFLEFDAEEDGAKAFHQARRLAEKTMSAPEVGWYMFKDVAIETYAPRGAPYPVCEWLDDAADFFAQNIEEAMQKLRAHLEDERQYIQHIAAQRNSAESNLRRLEMDEARKREIGFRGWVEWAIALAFLASARVSSDSKQREKAREWYKKARASFDVAEDRAAHKAIKSHRADWS